MSGTENNEDIVYTMKPSDLQDPVILEMVAIMRDSPEGAETLTWDEMVVMCPDLEVIRSEYHAWAKGNTSSWLDNRAWPLGLKPLLRVRVGWWSELFPRGHKMRSHQAWGIAHKEIYQKAPIPKWLDPEDDYASVDDSFVSSLAPKVVYRRVSE